MRLSLLMFVGIKAPILTGLWDFLITTFYISDRKQYTSRNGLIPILLTYMVYAKVWFQVATYSLRMLVV